MGPLVGTGRSRKHVSIDGQTEERWTSRGSTSMGQGEEERGKRQRCRAFGLCSRPSRRPSADTGCAGSLFMIRFRLLRAPRSIPRPGESLVEPFQCCVGAVLVHLAARAGRQIIFADASYSMFRHQHKTVGRLPVPGAWWPWWPGEPRSLLVCGCGNTGTRTHTQSTEARALIHHNTFIFLLPYLLQQRYQFSLPVSCPMPPEADLGCL